jgi:predicted amidohydrolase
MKLCVAQTKPVKGDIQKNIANHKRLIDLATSNGADVVIFPELSIIGYEPALAQQLATTVDDYRFDDFQSIADARQITIGIGMPIKYDAGITISMVLFHPQQVRQIYSKKYIHADEEPFFVPGTNSTCLIAHKSSVALAICYELSIPEHSADAAKSGAEVYIASVVKTPRQLEAAIARLSAIAKQYFMTVLMANCVGQCDGSQCGGKTSIWNNQGELLGQLDAVSEGILMIDTATKEVVQKTIQSNVPQIVPT